MKLMSDGLFNLVLPKKERIKLFFRKRIVKKHFESGQVTPSLGKTHIFTLFPFLWYSPY